MSTTRKKQIFKAMKFHMIEISKFYSSEIKWVYSIQVPLQQLFIDQYYLFICIASFLAFD